MGKKGMAMFYISYGYIPDLYNNNPYKRSEMLLVLAIYRY